MVRSTSSTAIGLSATMCCAAFIASIERTEVANADGAAPQQGRKFQLDAVEIGEGAFRPDQKMGEIEPPVGLAAGRGQGVKIVAADPSLNGGNRAAHLVGLARSDVEEIVEQRATLIVSGEDRQGRPARVQNAPPNRRRARASIDEHIVAHRPIAKRSAAARIVARHAAEGRARGGGDVDREPQPVRLQPPIEFVEHDAGLDLAARASTSSDRTLLSRFEQSMTRASLTVWPLCEVPPPRASTGTPWIAQGRGRASPLDRFGNDDADGDDLIGRRIGGVTAARESVEPTSPTFSSRRRRSSAA